ncbi:MAG TPA: hypothetical protein VGP19_03585 [Candidatus Acidoferrales bacterium]|jgi:hypothetical protein|nr:hypothetical protein [Candidatus Acidoferrales bacterium]
MTRHRFPLKFLCLLAGAWLLSIPARANPAGATIIYRRVFKSSTPEFIEIKISDQGKSSYDIRQLEDDADPEPFEVGPAVQKKIFDLAGELKDFAITSLDIQKKIANLGQKTFRYERGAEVHETSFNYTVDPSAVQLMQIFEGLAKQQQDLVLLQRQAKFDRLGVNDALMQFESDMDHRLLPEPERLLPILDQIAADSHFLEIARSRARALAERIRTSRDN